MKNLLFMILLIVSITSCKKEEVKAPAPVPPPPGMSATELAIVGHWNLVLTEQWYADTVFSSAPHNDSINCKIDFYSTIYPYNLSGWYDAIGGLDCTNAEFGWKITGSSIMLQGIYYQLITQNATDLIFQSGSTTTGAFRYHYKK